MAKEIKFIYRYKKRVWVSGEIQQASMGFIEVARKGVGFLRVYTYTPGSKPVLAYTTQQAVAAFCLGALPKEVSIVMESEVEVESASIVQDGDTVIVNKPATTLPVLKIEGNYNALKQNIDGTDEGYKAVKVSVYDFVLGDPLKYTMLRYRYDGDNTTISDGDPWCILFTEEDWNKFDGLSLTIGGEIYTASRDELIKNYTVETVSDFISQGMDFPLAWIFKNLGRFGVDLSAYKYVFNAYNMAGLDQTEDEAGIVNFIYDGKTYAYDKTMVTTDGDKMDSLTRGISLTSLFGADQPAVASDTDTSKEG